MRCKYPNRDLQQRLDGTICRYKGKAVYVRCGGDVGTLSLWYLPSSRRNNASENIKADDPYFDISTPSLGYFQAHKDRVAYASRRPMRLYKQGISPDNLMVRGIDGKNLFEGSDVYGPGFADMVNEKFDSLKNSIAEVRKSPVPTERVVSKDIAIRWDSALKLIFVSYQMEPVGFITEDSNTVIVPSSEKAWVVSMLLHGYSWEVQ